MPKYTRASTQHVGAREEAFGFVNAKEAMWNVQQRRSSDELLKRLQRHHMCVIPDCPSPDTERPTTIAPAASVMSRDGWVW